MPTSWFERTEVINGIIIDCEILGNEDCKGFL